MNDIILFSTFTLLVLIIVLTEFRCTSRRTDKDVAHKHSLLISCGYEYLYDTHLCMFYWHKDDRYYFEEDLKYLKLRELEEIVK